MILAERIDYTFKLFINKQLEPYNKTFEDVKDVPEWYSIYTTTRFGEAKFRDWGVDILRKRFKFTKTRAEKEMDFFIASFGLRMEENKSENTKTNKRYY